MASKNADHRASRFWGKEIEMFVANTNRAQVVADNPGATKIVKVEGGYMVFATITDYQIWENQR